MFISTILFFTIFHLVLCMSQHKTQLQKTNKKRRKINYLSDAYPGTFHCPSHYTVGQIQVILGHQYFTFPRAREWAKWASERTIERSGGREWSKQSRASEQVSCASERVNGRASGPVLTSRFLAALPHCALPHAFPPKKSL